MCTGLGVLQRPQWALSSVSTSLYDVSQYAISLSTAWPGAINCYFPAVTHTMSAVTSFVRQIPALWHIPFFLSSPRTHRQALLVFHLPVTPKWQSEGWGREASVAETRKLNWSGRRGRQSQMTKMTVEGHTRKHTLCPLIRLWGLMTLCPLIPSQCPQDLAQCLFNRWIIPACWMNPM